MAFPTIADADTKNGTVTTNSASWTLTYPTNIAAGDLLVGFYAADGGTVSTWPAGWVQQFDESPGAVTCGLAFKKAVGGETGTFTLGLGVAEQGGWRIFRITGWFGGSVPLSGAFESDSLSLLSAQAASGNPDPPALDPVNWGVEDTLWFAACGVDTSRTVASYPFVIRNTSDVSGGAGGATLAICTSAQTVGSLDPGVFTMSASDDWAAFTVAVRPAAAAAAAVIPDLVMAPYRS